MYQLIFHNQKNLLPDPNQDRIQGVSPIRENINNIIILIRQGRKLIGYNYLSSTERWFHRWNETIFTQEAQYPLDRYPWLVVDNLLPNKHVVVLNHPVGIRFYQLNTIKPGLDLLKEDGNFHEVYGFSLLFGKFYPNADWVGVMTRNVRGEIKFYAATQDSFLPEETDPLFPLTADLSLTADWHEANTEFFVTRLHHHGQEVIGLRTAQGIVFYQFNTDYHLEQVIHTSQLVKPLQGNHTPDRLLFANLTHQRLQDILHFNASGLFTYQYNNDQKDYRFLNRHTGFTQSEGWSPYYSDSIRLVDLNQDNLDDLLFTGPQGICALTFESATAHWQKLLSSDHLPGVQRYATVVGTLPPLPPTIQQPSIFIQDSEGKVQWAKVVPMPTISTTTTTIPPSTSTLLTTSQSPRGDHVLLPKQITRKMLPEKPILRWTEQWADHFLKEAVDMGSGQVQFHVPLVDISAATGWKWQLSLFYHSHAMTAELLGIGWSLSLAQDYIIVDHRGSIYSEDAHYYLMLQGRPQRLKRIASTGGIVRFQLNEFPDDQQPTAIEYHSSEQRWIIDSPVEQVVYGKANHKAAKDALRWGLNWPNWRGTGRDKAQQQPFITAWYLTCRFNKLYQQSLYYDYDQEDAQIPGGKTYTSAVRLKQVRDNQQLQLVLDYAVKTPEEYTAPSPVDDEGNIASFVSLAQSYYLQGYHITTATYRQMLKFIYQIQEGNRLLTAIQQPLIQYNESVLQLSYRNLLGKPVLESCQLPGRSTVDFSYENLTVPPPTVGLNSVLRYPIRETPKIAAGLDYTVMAYRDLNPTAGKIILRFMNREMTHTTVDCSVEPNFSCPTAESAIENYAIQAYPNLLIVFVESDSRRTLYLFNRHQQKWSSKPTVFIFSKVALIRFSETLIAVSEENKSHLILFQCASNQSNWANTTLNIPRSITRLAVHERLVVAYDEYQLSLFYQDSQSDWQQKELFVHDSQQTWKVFDLEHDVHKQWLSILNQNGLQIINNFIAFNYLQENRGQLTSFVHLFLLDDQYQIAKTQLFTIQQENIYQLIYNFKHENSVYQLGYVKANGKFKVKIKTISGEIVKDIESIRNKNRRQDAMEERIKQLNQAEGWKEYLKKSFLVNQDLYIIQINQQGIYCGNNTLLRITGTGWQRELLPTKQTIHLGKHFILEPTNDSKLSYQLYQQNSRQSKQGSPLRQLSLCYPGQLINRYPAYIAYQTTTNSVNMVTFKDDQTLGPSLTFNHEQLLLESDWQNLVTIANTSTTTQLHAEAQECLIRPVSTLVPPKPQLFIKKMRLTAGGESRITGYQRSFSCDQQALTYSETVAMIPGANKRLSGWYEATRSYHINYDNTTKTERWFNALSQAVLAPIESSSSEPEESANNTSSVVHSAQLLDQSGRWLISDFSPYSLADEMGAYYGFESYENNRIGAINANSSTPKTWHLHQAQIIQRGFALTGENYLQLQSTSQGTAFLEGLFQPHYQSITYLAACWVRCHMPLRLDTPVSYLRAILISEHGEEFIGLQAQVKYQSENWSYLELPIDFQLIQQIYQNYTNYRAQENHSLPDNVKETRFKIRLRVESPLQQTIDIDHIRFSPLSHAFQATIYQQLTGNPTAVIQANGLVIKTIYNRLQRRVASLQEEGQLEYFSSSSRTGILLPTPQGSITNPHPNTLIFEPEQGFYETFNAYALHHRWRLDNPTAWNIAPGQLWHQQSGKHRIEATIGLLDNTTAAIRCYFALQTPQAALSLHWHGIGHFQFTRQLSSLTTLALPNGHSITPLPSAGELIVMLENHYAWLWLDGVLLLDQALSTLESSADSPTPWSSFALEAQGQVLVEDCLIMNRPQLRVEYHNAWGDKTQVIQLEKARTAQITETLYDELGREAITTKTTRIHRTAEQPLLTYRPDFISNKNPTHQQPVWQTGYLQGEVDRLNPGDQGFAYARTQYAPNPLNQKSILGLPGADFSITGRYATQISQHSDIAFLSNLFPSHQGYRQQVENTPNGSCKVSVFDKHNNQVARYVRVPSYNHMLSTYEYDTENRLVKILPPLYHEKVETAIQLTPWQPGEQHLSIQEKQWQHTLSTRFIYDKQGHLIRKITPDRGITEYLYNAAGNMRFMIALGSTNQTQQIVYFDYDMHGQISRTGHLRHPLSITTLRQHLESPFLPYTQEYQQFYYADEHPDPLSRGRIKYCITSHAGERLVENLRFNGQQQMIAKSAITISGQAEADQLTEIKKQYLRDKIHTLTYPVQVEDQSLRLLHHYNKLGQLIRLEIPNQPNHHIGFTYHATGQLASEQYQFGKPSSFTRRYRYNSPGFLEQISDPFITEEIIYTGKGYGQSGYGDGMVMQAAFNASWSENADSRWFQLRKSDLEGNHSAVCIQALQRLGYLTATGQPIKLYLRKSGSTLPLVCDPRNIAERIAEKQPPRYYGHRYAYGNHQELVNAKYFTEDTEALVDPLQPDSFAKSKAGLTLKQSREIWHLLTKAGYIITHQQRTDLEIVIGKFGKSFFRDKALFNDLTALNDNYILYSESIKQLIVLTIAHRKILSLADFETNFLHWKGLDRTSPRLLYNQQQSAAQQIGQMLVDKGYLPIYATTASSALDRNFTTILDKYSDVIPEIIQVLSQYSAYALGETAFDVESYDIDANGNHRLFYTGFNRYQFTYHNASNQIHRIKLSGPIALEAETAFSIEHDMQGNVVQALHKGIQRIEYHPVLQRTSRIQLVDGRALRFYYDAQGERVLKRVFTAEGHVSHETRYLRDEQGRVLVDQQTKYLPESTQKIITAYLYSPKGLLGFIRNNTFYSVTTDHAGSVRLIIQSGQVVSAYDYLPYGQLMRSYGNDPKAHILYRYAGQEWDEETGLYNYHARLYDPSLGRFYQPDPKAQYFSPYKYAGNSPISVVDPDGEFAFIIIPIIIGAAAGAYLGGAVANNRWNPADWDFKDSGTWLGIGGGGLAGALLPIGFSASVAAIGGAAGGASLGTVTIGITFAGSTSSLAIAGNTLVGTIATVGLGGAGAYVMTAGTHGNWNPLQWQWDQPHTWSAIFQGFSAGSGIAGGIGLAHNFANTGKALTALSQALGISREAGKMIFLTVSYTAGGAVAYGHGVMANDGNSAFWQWDLANPATWSAVVDGFDIGMGWPQNFIEIGRGIGRLAKNPKNFGSQLSKSASKRAIIKAILKNPKHPFYKVITSLVMAYFMGSSANDELDITQWKLASFSTYEGVLNGAFFGKDTTNLLKYARSAKIKKLNSDLALIPKNKINNWQKKISRFLDNIQLFRKKIEYQNLIEHVFSAEKRQYFKLKLQDKPTALREFEKFFKRGLEKWIKGENKPPEALQKIILKQVDQEIHRSSNKLLEWKAEAEDFYKKQQEVFPDREVEFLSCQHIAKRKKRQVDLGNSCIIPVINLKENKPELIEQLFDIDPTLDESDNYRLISPKDKSSPQGFAEHFSLFLEKTPNILAANKPEFFQGVILGSILTSNLPKDSIFIESIASSNVLNVYHKKETNSQTKLVLKSFVIGKAGSIDKIPTNRLNTLCKSLELNPGTYPIEQTIFQIKPDRSLLAKKIPLENFSYENPTSTIEIDLSTIKRIDPIDIGSHLNKISSNEIASVKEAAEELLRELLNTYDGNKELNFKANSESGFHGFVYGALDLNNKYRYNLDVYVERIAGRGYADLMFLSRKGPENSKNWQAIPIVIEFKADKTPASGALKQITSTSYLYNLSMRTIAEKSVIIGINSGTKPGETNLMSRIQDIPKPEGFINQLIKFPDESKFKENLKEELKHLYYSISPLSIKTIENKNNHYLSNLILGELLSKNEVYVNKNPSEEGLMTFLFKKENSKYIMLNVVESSEEFKGKYYFEGIGDINNLITLPDKMAIHYLTVVNVKVNSKSKAGWSSETGRRNIEPGGYYFQGVDVDIDSTPSNMKKSENYVKVESIDIEKILEGFETEKELNKLSVIKNIINSESDFQAILQGLVYGKQKRTLNNGLTQIIRVFTEANLSKEGRSDIIINKLMKTNNNIHEEAIIVMEIKYSSNNGYSYDIDNKLNDGIDQISKYKANLKSVTDLGDFKPMVIVFDKETGQTRVHILEDGSIDHSSQSESDDYHSPFSNLNIDGEINAYENNEPDSKRIKYDVRKKRFIGKNSDLYNESNAESKNHQSNAIPIAISSGANRLQFWPIEMIKSIKSALLISAHHETIPTDNYNSTYLDFSGQTLLPDTFPVSKQSATWITHLWKGLQGILVDTSPRLSPTTHSYSQATSEYTSTHLQGGLQLLDLVIRKWTGKKYSPPALTIDFDMDDNRRIMAAHLAYSAHSPSLAQLQQSLATVEHEPPATSSQEPWLAYLQSATDTHPLTQQLT